MTDIKVGDIVTVRAPDTKGYQPMGITGCRVLQFYEVPDDDGNGMVPGALVDAGKFGEICVYRSHLHLE